MVIPIIRIGNSKGILLNKTLLERYKLKEKVEIVMKPKQIELKPVCSPREGWDEKFKMMHQKGDDKPIIDDFFEDDHFEEWK